MDFRFDQDEQQLLDQAGATFRRWLPPERLLTGSSTAAAWDIIAADGWLAAGSTGDDDALSLALVAGIGREAGRVLAGEGFVTNAVLLAAAEEPVAPGFLIADGRSEPVTGPTGETPVPWCFGVETGLVAYRIDDAGTLHRCEGDAWDFQPAGRLALGVGTITPTPMSPVSRISVTDELLTSAQIVHAATLVGLGETVIGDAVDYAKQRMQFDRPIGGFQAVKHPLADATIALEVAWNAVLYAALRPADTTAAIARLQAKNAADLATRVAAQTFGGIAMTWEHSMHLYLKTAQASLYRFGAPDDHALRLAEYLMKEGEAA
ncbi:acyl-CoA dehydrogenase family protein [Actinomadura rugatobispora]|uniref:Acyl-CoA dehydrogenase family protein n=1 Tax=Actinomadura rugatobispora TaxID=1994 RepID=A0ABW1A6X2_9ACTN|nr:hypothetical protein GCM10010200_084200 [Actinomadura rugatobispora]